MAGGAVGSLATVQFWQKGDNRTHAMATFENNLFVRNLDVKTLNILSDLNRVLAKSDNVDELSYRSKVIGEAHAIFSEIKIHSAGAHTFARLGHFGNQMAYIHQTGRTQEEYYLDMGNYFSDMLHKAAAWTMDETVNGSVWLRKKDDIGLLHISTEAHKQLQEIKGIAKETIVHINRVLEIVEKQNKIAVF